MQTLMETNTHLKHILQNEYRLHFVSRIFLSEVVLGGISFICACCEWGVLSHCFSLHAELNVCFSSQVRLRGKVNLIFCGNVLTETAAALYSTISTAAVSVLLLSGGQGWRLHFKWKPWWNSNRKYRQIWTADRALRDTLSFKSHSW